MRPVRSAITAVTLLIAGAGAGPALAADPPAPPMALPGDASAASVRADRSSWIVAARPGPPARTTARRFGARALGPAGVGAYVLPSARARSFAAALRSRGLLAYAEPNRLSHSLDVPDDPLSGPPNAWRQAVVDPALDPPAVTADSPLIALVDSQLDLSHPEFSGDNNVRTLGSLPINDAHGTATAAVAVAPKNDVGMLGVWPGARALNVPLPDEITCSESARQILRAIDEGASVINMSYGSQSPCFAEYTALQIAIARGVVPVAAAGNEFADGNPLEFPASLPHVLTVASVGADNSSSYFSSSSAAVDLSAPGEGILTAVPAGLEEDLPLDGYEKLSGTSFSAPMAAAAAAWVQADRPELTNDQVTQVLRLSAEDLGVAGWDRDTGFGLLSVGAALQRQPPPPDPTEPNDDMVWIDGRAFSQPDRPIYTGNRTRRFSASLDRFEDPADVYRIRIPARSRARVSAEPSFGNPELAGYKGGARSLGSRRLARSRRSGERTERITLRNRSRGKRTFYIALTVQGDASSLDVGYRLTVRR